MASKRKKKPGGLGPTPSPILSRPHRPGTRRGILCGGTKYDSASEGPGFFFDLYDLDAESEAIARVRLSFLAHGFAPDPRHPSRAALFEKWGPGGAYVDLVDRTVIAPIEPKPGHHFYGHGTFTVDGDAVFAVETDLDTHKGVITVRDPDTFAVVDEMPSFGQNPHDCMLVGDGHVLAITNGGGPLGGPDPGCVTWVDVRQKKLVDRRPVPNLKLNAGHVAISSKGDVAIVSAPREGLDPPAVGGVTLASAQRPLTSMGAPVEVTSKLVGEALSVTVLDDDETVVATHPFAHTVTIWDLKKKALKRAMSLPSARGVTLSLDRSLLAISFAPAAKLLLLDPATLNPVEELGERVFGGSHIYPWAYPV